MPDPQKPLGVGSLRSRECRFVLVSRMSRRDERIGAMLKYFDGNRFSQDLDIPGS